MSDAERIGADVGAVEPRVPGERGRVSTGSIPPEAADGAARVQQPGEDPRPQVGNEADPLNHPEGDPLAKDVVTHRRPEPGGEVLEDREPALAETSEDPMVHEPSTTEAPFAH